MRFAETDMMGIVHHSAYIVWFEAARIAWMDAVGVPYYTVAEAGRNFAVTDVNARYRSSIRLRDPVRIFTQLTLLRSRQVAFAYEVRHRESNHLFATGSSRHICVDGDGRPALIPDWVLAPLESAVT